MRLNPVHRSARQGIALVITLILLSVTLVMAVAFLALSRRDRNAVATVTDTATARLAADTALAAAQAQVVANIFSTTNRAAYDFGLVVSTNYINAYGFNPAAGANPTNVNYDYYSAIAGPLAANHLIQNIANLWYLPRVPVYVNTNSGKPLDFRYFLDLNRNAKFEDSGDNVANVELDLSGIPFTNGFGKQVGDPQWIGVLEKPDQPHGPNNPFVARYAFLAQPIGNGLDLNYIHNQAITRSLTANDGYFRNQGVGSWELNLAGFLADLNTNTWSPDNFSTANYYQYNEPLNFNRGIAFDDARNLLAYRYNYNFNNLASAAYSLNGAADFPNDNIDGYSDGAQQVTTTNIIESFNPDNETRPWSGSDNTNRFFSVNSDLFDVGKLGTVFTDRLKGTGTNASTYNRYTYYRMLEQMGTDSTADVEKMNLNYDNLDYSGAVVPYAETNMMAWTPLRFFTNAANRMLRYYTTQWATNRAADLFDADTNYVANFSVSEPFDTGNIPVLVSNRFVYTPAVNRLLQLAANLFDASTNNAARLGKDFPSVFRPVFKKVRNGSFNDIYICGYHSIGNGLSIGTPPLDMPLDVTAPGLIGNAGPITANANAYGVPWIIGAKKGFPNFNQFYMRNLFQVTRKLQVTRSNGAVSGAQNTNQLFVMSVTNRLGFSFWNSYESNYTGNLTVYFRDIAEMRITNAAGSLPIITANPNGNPSLVQFVFQTNYSVWPGSQWKSFSPNLENPAANKDSFISGYWDFAFLPESTFDRINNSFISTGVSTAWESGVPQILPQFSLQTTNRIQAIILDNGHLIDYVQISGPQSSRNLTMEISDTNSLTGGYWNTNIWGSGVLPTWGVFNQFNTSKNPSAAPANWGGPWVKPPNLPSNINTPAAAAAYFAAFFTPGYIYNGTRFNNTNLQIQFPYTPSRAAWSLTLYQANDPLVHYTEGDLKTYRKGEPDFDRTDNLSTSKFSDETPDLNSITERYQPWGSGNNIAAAINAPKDNFRFDSSLHDPLLWGSDYWDFPGNLYPAVGWIGRVHRGTPWQSIYLKSTNLLTKTYSSTGNTGINTWVFWTGNTRKTFGNYFDAVKSAPVRDSELFDLFTTRFNDNAAHGMLSVNQEHLAAWSAALSGMLILTNSYDSPNNSIVPSYTNYNIISPAGVDVANSAIGKIVNGPSGINVWRSTMFTNADNTAGYFQHVGDILRVPALSEQSPFLLWNDADQQHFGISDEVYEWLPQQLMGLLRVSSAPRYVLYCYGQALRPAPGSQVLSSTIPNTFGMVTNYQVVAESAARVVIRFERKGTNYTSVVESYNPLPPE